MNPRYAATLALSGWFLWMPSAAKTIPGYCPDCAVTLVAENSSQNADTEAAEAETQAAENVRQRHLPDMLKIPHVVNMGIEFKDRDIVFNLQVDKQENVPQVERIAPSKIEGYDVVVEAVPRGGVLPLSRRSFSMPISPPDGQ
jgi:hypothetical protein